jgi:hypothetical protein
MKRTVKRLEKPRPLDANGVHLEVGDKVEGMFQSRPETGEVVDLSVRGVSVRLDGSHVTWRTAADSWQKLPKV